MDANPTNESVSSRKFYAGLKILPDNSYKKLNMYNEMTYQWETHFQCLYAEREGRGDAQICGKSFSKSTSLIVHYQRHINLKPFACDHCNLTFAQVSTLTRHIRCIHKQPPGDNETN